MAPSLTLFPMGYVAMAARSWRYRGRHLVTVIVKGTFDLAHQGFMTLAPPAAIVSEERRLGGGSDARVVRASDLALVVPSPEVIVVGAAYSGAPRGVRLLVQRDGKAVLDKQLEVPDDRSAAGLGPTPVASPARARLRGGLADWPGDGSAVLHVPDDFDDTFFQSAPPDQRVPELRGGDLLTLVGLHPKIEALRSYLPLLRGVALLQTSSAQRIPVNLRVDTVHLEPEVLRGEIVYRGSVSVAPEQLAELRIAGALEMQGNPFTFPDLATARAPSATSSPSSAAPSSSSTTLVLEPRAPRSASSSGTLLLEPSAQPSSGTLVLDSSSASPPRSTLPFETPKRAVTIQVDAEHAPRSLPFPKGKRRKSGQLPTSAPSKDATPWSESQPAAPVPASKGAMSTLLVEDEPRKEEPATQGSAAKPGKPVDPDDVQWRKDPPTEAALGPSAPKPVIVPRTNVRGAVYKRPKR